MKAASPSKAISPFGVRFARPLRPSVARQKMVRVARVGPRIAKRSSMLFAIVAVARKLASILHRMWVSEIPRRPRRKGNATAASETCAVIVAFVPKNCAGLASSALKRSKDSRSARAASVPWRGRETGNVRYLLPATALRG
jgi:hypothetical protein